MTLTVVSYLSPRPSEYGDRAHSYGECIELLEASCVRANCTHVVLTEEGNENAIPKSIARDRIYAVSGTHSLPLMQATVAGLMMYLGAVGVADEGTILVGADCIITRDPRPVFANADWDVGVTVGVYSPGGLNNIVYLAPGAGDKAVLFYELAHMNCRPEWGGDQESVRQVVLPLEKPEITVERHGIKVRFFDMDGFNCPPACSEDSGAARSYVAHFKGPRKSFMAAWAHKQLGIERPFVVA